MIKRFFAMLAAGLLLFSCTAMAQTDVTSVEYNWYSAELNKGSNTIAVQPERNGAWYVADAEGNLLSDPYAKLNTKGTWFECRNEDGPNKLGALDGQGKLIIPMNYIDIKCFSDRWMAGVVGVDATSDNYDYYTTNYSTSEKTYYLIDTVDIYYCGQLAGTLTRPQFDNYCTAHGDYLYIRDRDSVYHYYDKTLTESGYPESSSSEYHTAYQAGKTIIYHRGTGLPAFTADCTLTPDEVEIAVHENKGNIYDLQGNIVKTVDYYSVYSFGDDGLAKVSNRAGQKGLIDTKGNELLPCIYDDIGYEGIILDTIFVEKDGKAGYVNVATGEKYISKYAKSAVRTYGAVSYVTDLDGSKRMFSICGELPESYEDFSAQRTVPFFAVKKDNACALLDLTGDIVLPFDENITSTYTLNDISEDGTMMLVRTRGTKGYIYTVYHLAYSGHKPVQSAAQTAEAPAVSGPLFCANCGAPQTSVHTVEAPVDGGWYCPLCGTHYGPSANFCANDGTRNPLK